MTQPLHTQAGQPVKKEQVRYADLHLHTFFSDSTYSPEGLLKEAERVGLSCISVVDHDTVAGIQPALDCAKGKAIEVIPGIELTAEYEGLEIHILGYFIDYQNKNLCVKLEDLKKRRIARVHKIVAKLKDIGIDLAAESVFELARQGTVGRLHVARAMAKAGLVGSTAEAFNRFIGDKCPAYVLGFRMSPPEAIKLIKEFGGIPVLAHPYSMHNDGLIARLIEYGIMGLEVYYPEHTPAMVKSYLGLTKSYHLLVTGGSDCHGKAKPEIKIGSLKVDYALVEELKKAKERISA